MLSEVSIAGKSRKAKLALVRTPVDLGAKAIHTDDAVQGSGPEGGNRAKGGPVSVHGKRVTIGDLLKAGLAREGDQRGVYRSRAKSSGVALRATDNWR